MPIDVASTSVARIADSPVGSAGSDSKGSPTALTVTIAATERSIPPATTTKVCPAATSPMTAASSTRRHRRSPPQSTTAGGRSRGDLRALFARYHDALSRAAEAVE